MELTMSNGLCEMSVNEILLLDGGEWSWSWSDFGASTAGNCVGGAAAGGKPRPRAGEVGDRVELHGRGGA